MDDLTLSVTRDALTVFNVVGLIAVGVVTWLRKPGTEAQESVQGLRTMLTSQTAELTKTMSDNRHMVDNRLTLLEERIHHMPTAEKMAELQGTFRALASKVESMKEVADGTRASVTRIEQFLMSSSRP